MVEFFCFWKGVSIAYAEGLDTLPQNLREIRPTVMAVVPRVLEKMQGRVMDGVRQAACLETAAFRLGSQGRQAVRLLSSSKGELSRWACG